jgi:hypothetical protein
MLTGDCEREHRWLDRKQLGAWVRLLAVLELLPGVLDRQLRRDAGLTHFEYYTVATLSEAPDGTLRMTTTMPPRHENPRLRPEGVAQHRPSCRVRVAPVHVVPDPGRPPRRPA